MGALRTPREKWIEAGLTALASGGVDSVRVESLAKSLGVTKGGFYGYFSDRGALLDAMLDAWEREVVDDVLERVADEVDDLVERARLAGRLTFAGERSLAVDLAVRDWARRDPTVAERLREVDNRRMQVVRDAISTTRRDPADVEMWCLIAFCLAIGTHLTNADHGDLTRTEVMARASALILNRS